MKNLITLLFILLSISGYGQNSHISISTSDLELNKIIVEKYNYCEQERWLLEDSISNLNKTIQIKDDSIKVLNKIIFDSKNEYNEIYLFIIFGIALVLFIFLIIAFNKSIKNELERN